MKNYYSIIIFIILVSILPSCSQDKISNDVDSNVYDIDHIVKANEQEKSIVLSFFEKKEKSDNLKFGSDYTYSEPEVVNYTNLPGKAIVINYKSDLGNLNTQRALILVVSDDAEILTYYEYEKKSLGDTYIVNTFIEGNPWFTATALSETDEILECKLLLSNNLKMSFMECAKMAVGACVNDGGCAFMCGIVWQYCLGSIGLACAYIAAQ